MGVAGLKKKAAVWFLASCRAGIPPPLGLGCPRSLKKTLVPESRGFLHPLNKKEHRGRTAEPDGAEDWCRGDESGTAAPPVPVSSGTSEDRGGGRRTVHAAEELGPEVVGDVDGDDLVVRPQDHRLQGRHLRPARSIGRGGPETPPGGRRPFQGARRQRTQWVGRGGGTSANAFRGLKENLTGTNPSRLFLNPPPRLKERFKK